MLRPKILLLILVGIAFSLVFSDRVAAVSNVGPDPADMSVGDVYFQVARTGANYQLNAPRSVVKIFSTTPNGTLRIIDGNYCANNSGGIDSLSGGGRGVPITTYQIYNTAPDPTLLNGAPDDEPAGARVGITVGSTNCANRDILINYSGLTRSGVPGHTNYYVAYVTADLFGAGTANSINGFRYQLAAGGVVSTYAQSTNQFAMGQMWLLQPRTSTMQLKFAPPCNLTSPVVRSLEWYDADIGESNQPGSIPTVLTRIDKTTGAQTNVPFDLSGGNGVSGQRNITIEPNSVYIWTINNVHSQNGIQYQLPYDSINAIQNCPTAQPNLSCLNLTTNPTSPTVGIPFNMTVTFRNTGAGDFTNVSLTVTITGSTVPAMTNVPFSNNGGPPLVPNNLAANGSGSATINNISVPQVGSYSVQVLLSGGNVPPGHPPCTLSPNLIVSSRPYYEVRGDAIVGAAFTDSTGVCNLESSARFLAFHDGTSGAGTQFATLALGVIEGHVSASKRTASPQKPKGLTFANTNNTAAFGGNANASYATCLPDYFSLGEDPLDPSTTPPPYELTGNTTINFGTQTSLFVNGDYFIDGNIFYQTGNYPDAANIPRFMLVVKGDIYISGRVNNIDGILIAQPRADNSGGRIITCGFRDTSPGTYRLPTAAEMNDSATTGCQRKLTITGAVVAQSIRLLRTHGTVGGSPNEPAEEIIFSPEVWLNSPIIESGRPQGYRSLPPVL